MAVLEEVYVSREKTAQTHSEVLLRELEALRAERRKPAETEDEARPVDQSTSLSGSSFDMNWDEVREVIQEIGDELEKVAHQRPLLGMVGAFVLGVVIGRVVMR